MSFSQLERGTQQISKNIDKLYKVVFKKNINIKKNTCKYKNNNYTKPSYKKENIC